jgi:hypothetical protein
VLSSFRQHSMLTVITCGPISVPAIVDDIPFICSLFVAGGNTQVSVMYGVGCKADTDQLWCPFDIATVSLSDWIARMAQDGVYEPGRSDLFIFDDDRLTARLCHEADIHIETRSLSIIQICAYRWLGKGYRLMRSDAVPTSRDSWREIRSIEEATSGLQST